MSCKYVMVDGIRVPLKNVRIVSILPNGDQVVKRLVYSNASLNNSAVHARDLKKMWDGRKDATSGNPAGWIGNPTRIQIVDDKGIPLKDGHFHEFDPRNISGRRGSRTCRNPDIGDRIAAWNAYIGHPGLEGILTAGVTYGPGLGNMQSVCNNTGLRERNVAFFAAVKEADDAAERNVESAKAARQVASKNACFARIAAGRSSSAQQIADAMHLFTCMHEDRDPEILERLVEALAQVSASFASDDIEQALQILVVLLDSPLLPDARYKEVLLSEQGLRQDLSVAIDRERKEETRVREENFEKWRNSYAEHKDRAVAGMRHMRQGNVERAAQYLYGETLVSAIAASTDPAEIRELAEYAEQHGHKAHVEAWNKALKRHGFPDVAFGGPNRYAAEHMAYVADALRANTANTVAVPSPLDAGNSDSLVRAAVAENPNTPSEELAYLADEKETWYHRQKRAESPDTPPAQLAILVNDSSWLVRLAVAENPNTSMEDLEKLTNDGHPSIRQSAALPPAERLELVAKALDEDLADEKEIWHERLARAESPNASPEELTILANDPDWRVRRAVAANPNTSMEDLEKLGFKRVQDAAAAEGAVAVPSPLDVDKDASPVALVAEAYKIGDVGPGGGIIFSIKSGTYLEAAPKDIGEFTWKNALSAARNYSHGGCNDWFLPSIYELNEMYENRDLIGGFSTDLYWSSSELAALIAWLQTFANGLQISTSKSLTGYVRPVRAFSI